MTDIKFKISKFQVKSRSWKERHARVRVYIFPDGEGGFQHLFNRHARPYTIWRKLVMPRVLRRLGMPKDTKFKWSRKCGCSCGCSPGFIVYGEAKFEKDGQTYTSDFVDVFVTVKGLPRIDKAVARASNKVYPEFGSVAENAG